MASSKVIEIYLHLFWSLGLLLISSLAGLRALIFRGSPPGDTPVKYAIVREALANKHFSEKCAEVCIVGLFAERKVPRVVEEDAELVGEATAEFLDRSRLFLPQNEMVFLFLGCCLEALPWESTSQEVHEDVPKSFEVITSPLL